MTMPSERSPQPADLGSLIALAQSEQNAGRLPEAAAAYRQILALRPDMAEAHNNLGNVLSAEGQLRRGGFSLRVRHGSPPRTLSGP